MPTLIAGNNTYPSLETVSGLVRSLVNDDQAGATGTVGEGQIFVDNPLLSPAMQQFLNSALRWLYRGLRNVGDPTLIADNYIVEGLLPFIGPYGQAVPAPETQVSIGFNGYFNGQTVNASQKLPVNLLVPLHLWERGNGSEDIFQPMNEAQGGLSPSTQVDSFGKWEWRGDAIWFPGALITRDVRIRYQMSLPTYYGPEIDFSTTYVPIMDSEEALAFRIAAMYARRLGSPLATEMMADADKERNELRNIQVRRAQGIDYMRIAHQNDDGMGLDEYGI